MSTIIFDSSTLISIGGCCLYGTLIKIKERNPDLRLIIPKGVVSEVIDIGTKVTKFAWSSSRIQRLVNDGIIEIMDITDKQKYTEFEENINNIFKTNHGNIEIMQRGEIEAIILMNELNADCLAVDELTTRLLIEKPQDLERLTERRYKTQVFVDNAKLKKYYDYVKNIKIIRSVDIVSHAYNLGLFEEFGKQEILRGLLYSLKYHGCATTFEEIDKYIETRGN